tara:strand:- start:271468 stop:272061 length:594 start_codon:yes stop_codon:yes gene_type:complete
MDRRKALKNLGLSLGLVVATPAVMSLLQSCKNDGNKMAVWNPEFFSKDEGIVVENLVDLILPPTGNIPGAKDVNVAKFLDLHASKVLDEQSQDYYKKGLEAMLNTFGKPVRELKTDDYDALLAKFLKASSEEREAFRKDENDNLVLNRLESLRGTAIWAYKTSEKVGEEVLVYDPIPGEQKGCISVEEATGGRAWSL